jgi:hypothetical protein
MRRLVLGEVDCDLVEKVARVGRKRGIDWDTILKMDLYDEFWAKVRVGTACGKSVSFGLTETTVENVGVSSSCRTVEFILQGHRRRFIGVEELAQRLRVESKLM